MAVLQSTLTCPECGHVSAEVMPENACLYFYECKSLSGDFMIDCRAF